MVASSVSKQCAIFLSQAATDGHRSDNEVLSKGTLSQISPIDVLEISYRGPEIAYTNSGLFLFYAYQQLVIR